MAIATVVLASVAIAQRAEETPLPLVRSWVLAGVDLAASWPRPPTHRMRLEMAIVSGTRWAPEVILAAARGAAAILAQCGVEVSSARLQEFDGPRRYRYLATPVSREFAGRSALGRPAVFFVDDTLQRPAFDAEAIGRANATRRPEMSDTVWITAATRDLPVALAHELVHVLTDSGAHSDLSGNLMREETNAGHTRLTGPQCDRVIAVGEGKGLLARK